MGSILEPDAGRLSVLEDGRVIDGVDFRGAPPGGEGGQDARREGSVVNAN